MNLKQQTFITEYLRFGDPVIAYHNAYKCYNSSYRTKESAANRLLKNPEVAEAISNAQERIRSEVEQELKEKLRQELLTKQRKREILARIAEGNIYVEQQYKGRDCRTCTQMVKPTFNQMLKAIDLDSKLTGDYTGQKQITAADTNSTRLASAKDEGTTKPANEKTEPSTNYAELNSYTFNEDARDLPPFGRDTEGRHISHAGLRKLLSTPVKKRREVQLE